LPLKFHINPCGAASGVAKKLEEFASIAPRPLNTGSIDVIIISFLIKWSGRYRVPSFYFYPLVYYGKELQKFFATPLAAPQGLLSHGGSSFGLIG
jgi:hypothetical protein